MKAEELLNTKIGILDIKEIDYIKSKDGRWYLICDCECGNRKSIRYDHLKSNQISSCGCKRRITSKKSMIDMNTSHNMSKTRFYKSWSSMKERCTLYKNDNYKRYIDNNIQVCYEWHDFVKFKTDMYESYLEHVSLYGEKNTTLDRIDFTKNYSIENCRWATYSVQANNKSNNTKNKNMPKYKGVE